MKYTEKALTMILVCLIILTVVIYTKPTPNRYRFAPPNSSNAGGVILNIYAIQDTATGKTYDWVSMISPSSDSKSNTFETVTMRDHVQNKTYTKKVKSPKIINKRIKEGQN